MGVGSDRVTRLTVTFVHCSSIIRFLLYFPVRIRLLKVKTQSGRSLSQRALEITDYSIHANLFVGWTF